METLRTAEKRTDDLPIPITEWTNEQLEEAYFYLEGLVPQSEVISRSLDAVISEQKRRKELEKG